MSPVSSRRLSAAQSTHRPVAAARPGAAVGTELTWLLVVHPNAEVAAARADLTRRAFPKAQVRFLCRSSEAVRWCAAQDTPGAALVHLRGLDRFCGGWGGDRLIARLNASGAEPVVAWVAEDDVDGRALAGSVGASGLVSGGLLAKVRGTAATTQWFEHSAAAAGPDTLSARHPRAEAQMAAWFQARYGGAWEPWIEHAAALLVGGGERTEQAEVLRRVLMPSTTDHARRRIRQVTETLCGEIRGNEALARLEALVVLGRIARLRPIEAAPLTARSLQRVAGLLSADPTLASEAGIAPHEVADLREVAAEELTVGLGGGRRRGRPQSGAWRVRREVALGRVAERRGGRAVEKIAALDELRRVIERVVDAVYDTVEDRDRDPLAA